MTPPKESSRLHFKDLLSTLETQEKRWHELIDAKVKVYTPDEIKAYQDNGGLKAHAAKVFKNSKSVKRRGSSR